MIKEILQQMKQCDQIAGKQTVLEHGISVKNYLMDLICVLKGCEGKYEWRLPSWIKGNEEFILQNLLPMKVLTKYTIFHDCGKPFCRTVDEYG